MGFGSAIMKMLLRMNAPIDAMPSRCAIEHQRCRWDDQRKLTVHRGVREDFDLYGGRRTTLIVTS
jgi:hypothetical protein